MTTQREYILDRLGKGDVPVTCFVGEFSNYATIQGRRIASVFRYHTDTDQYEDSDGNLWSYAVPVTIKPIELSSETNMSINQVNTQDGKKQSVILKYFEYQHLPIHLQDLSKNMHDLAHHMDQTLESGPEKSAGLRKLLEAKDCFVRAAL